MKEFISKLSKPKVIQIFFLIVFLWTLLVGLFVQKIALEYIFPKLNAGYGLLTGSDYMKFHRIAAELAEKIHSQGWDAWQLMPKDQAVSSVAAIFYTLFVPQPWVLLPWNALLHALAVFYLYQSLLLILKKKELALLASLPCAFFPSAFSWTIMMHNENYLLLGVMMALYSLVKLFHDGEKLNAAKFVYILLVNLAGHGLILMVRAATSQALAVINLFFLIAYGLLVIFRIWEPKNIYYLPKGNFNKRDKLNSSLNILLKCTLFAISSLFFINTMSLIPKAPANVKTVSRINKNWQRSNWWPAFVDSKLSQIVQMRKIQLGKYPHGATNVDELVQFNNAFDVVRYLPRAAQLGFLSPFPSQWFKSGFRAASKMQRLFSGAEMSLAYLALLALPTVFWRFRKAFDFWFLALACTGMIVIYAISMPNIGTLYRFRYPFFTPLLGIGLAAWIDLVFKIRKKSSL